MKIEELFKGCYLVVLPTTQELAKLFLRFQEHYESPNREFRNRAFSLEEYNAWYVAKYGDFTYYQDWEGFNVPGHTLEKFYNGEFKDISLGEQALLDYFKPKFHSDEKFYIIGVSEDNNREHLDHEKAHALFYLDHSYRFRLEYLLKRHHRDTISIRLHLRKIGYTSKVLLDETNAYLCFDDKYLESVGVDTKCLIGIRHNLRKLYQNFMENK